jgi:long-chain acyl-CoA synthetase
METLQDVLAEGATRFDRRPALMIRPFFRTRTWRYRDLGAVVPRAARVLADAGIGPGDRVIVWSVNRPEWGIAFFALQHLGAVAVPLDVRHTVDFGQKIVAQTEAKAVLASRQTEASARQLGLPILWVESLPDDARRVEPIPAAPVTGETLAEIVFTSGTTGEPKGAMLSHGNLVASATAMTAVLSFGDRDRLLSVLPLSHLYEQVLGFIGPLIVGASIVYPVSRCGSSTRPSSARSTSRASGPGSSACTASRGTRRGPSGGCCSDRSSPSSVVGCTRSAWAPRRSTWTSPDAGRTWAWTSCRVTAPPRWARS